MAWDSILAKDFCKSVRDGTHDTPKQMEMGYKLVTSKCIHDGFIFPEEAYFISEKDYRAINERSLVEQWDVLMSMIGNGLGRSAVVKQKPDYAIKNLALFKVGDEYKAKWLHYYLSSPVGQGLIYNSLQGSGQPFISLNLLRNFAIPNPPYEAIKKIVSVLELYDDLIENNQKQIKLLEEAAQRLYKQWFIDLRYPGHETTKIVDGLPEGWRKVTLGSALSKITTGLNPRKNFVLGQGKNFYVTIKNMGDNNIYLDDKCDRVNDEALEKINKRSDLKTGDILFSGIGTIGRVYLIDIPTNNWNVSESVFTMRVNECVSKEFLYLMLLSDDVQSYCDLHAHGVAQRGIRRADLKEYKFVLPENKIIDSFTTMVEPIIEKTQILRKSINSAAESRDRRLPKLMNGELEI